MSELTRRSHARPRGPAGDRALARDTDLRAAATRESVRPVKVSMLLWTLAAACPRKSRGRGTGPGPSFFGPPLTCRAMWPLSRQEPPCRRIPLNRPTSRTAPRGLPPPTRSRTVTLPPTSAASTPAGIPPSPTPATAHRPRPAAGLRRLRRRNDTGIAPLRCLSGGPGGARCASRAVRNSARSGDKGWTRRPARVPHRASRCRAPTGPAPW